MSPITAASLIVLLEGLSFGATFPVLSYYCQHLGGSPLAVGLMFALVSGPRIVTNPMFGSIADRVGRRPVLVFNTLGTLVGSITWAIAPTLTWLAISRLITGVCGAQAALSQAIVADVTTPDERAAKLGHLGAAFGIAFSLGPILGGLGAYYASYAAVGWLCALMQVLSLFVIVFGLRETTRAAASQRPEVHLMQRPRVLHLLSVLAIVTLGFSIFNGTYQLVAEHVYKFGPRRTSLAIAFSGIVIAAVQRGIVRRVARGGREPLLARLGMGVLACGFVMIALTPPEWVFWVSTAIVSIGTALYSPMLTALLSHCATADEQGSISGYSLAAQGIGRAGGTVLGGAMFQTGAKYIAGTSGVVGGPFAAFGTGALLVLIALGLFIPIRPIRTSDEKQARAVASEPA